MRLIVSGGGTAGHVSPILAIVDALKPLDKDLTVLYVGQNQGIESKIVQAAGLEFAGISAGKFRRYHGRKLIHKMTDLQTVVLNIRDSVRVGRGIIQSRRIIQEFKPDIVFIKGGYVGLPVGLAARQLHVPYLIHESDINPGLTNRVLAKQAAAVAVGFPAERYASLPKDKLVYTGNPIRQELLSKHRLEGLAHFKLSAKLPVVLVIGGSLGARAINQVVVKALPELLESCQVIHVTGEKDIEEVRFQTKRSDLKYPEHYRCFSFLLEDLGLALAAADLVVSRAGAGAIAELAALGKPTILIPHPNLSAGHQVTNAQALARQGAVRVIGEDKLTPQRLTAEVKHILESDEEQKLLERGIKKFSVPDASQRLASLIVDVWENHGA